jgi:hypothetical protein
MDDIPHSKLLPSLHPRTAPKFELPARRNEAQERAGLQSEDLPSEHSTRVDPVTEACPKSQGARSQDAGCGYHESLTDADLGNL